MELLSKLGIDWRLLTWQIINFVILLAILRKFAYRPILNILQSRSQRVEKGLADAKAASERLAKAEAEKEKILAASRAKASEMLREAEGSAAKHREEVVVKAKSEAEGIREAGRAEAAREKERMVSEARAELGALISAGVEKVLEDIAKQLDIAPVVEKTVRELKKSL